MDGLENSNEDRVDLKGTVLDVLERDIVSGFKLYVPFVLIVVITVLLE